MAKLMARQRELGDLDMLGNENHEWKWHFYLRRRGASRSIGDMAHFFFFIYKFPIQGSRARKSINFIVFEVVCKRVMISA